MTLAYAQTTPVGVEVTPLNASSCANTFVKHPLDHTTRAHGEEVTYYDSNGAGVAVGDLDNDGDLELVLANLDGNNTIFWNEGGLSFRKEALTHGDSRAVTLVDVDGDGWLDLVFTQSLGSLSYWKNVRGRLERSVLKGVTQKAYTMLWDDLDADGDLDLVTASYDSLLEKDLRDSFLFSSGAGVFVYEQTSEGFLETRLAERSQALAMTLFDLNDDGKRDLLVGNDFEVPDYAYLNTPEGWQEVSPFETTTRNTMSFDTGDVDNDGRLELFATDMKPDFSDPEALAAWMPLMEKSYQRNVSKKVQTEENILYSRTEGGFENLAYPYKLDATGWSWSGKFGDLDNDGRLDLYVVNGMRAKEVFAHLPNDELVEENQVFKNAEQGFEPMPEWNLNAREGGRGMTMADVDNDGDLDIIINNLESPAVLFENQLCGGQGLELDLFQSDGNTRALGATLKLHTSEGTMTREVKSGSGYLSGDAPRVHFGIPEDASLFHLEILWSDGAVSTLSDLSAHTLLTVTRQEVTR